MCPSFIQHFHPTPCTPIGSSLPWKTARCRSREPRRLPVCRDNRHVTLVAGCGCRTIPTSTASAASLLVNFHRKAAGPAIYRSPEPNVRPEASMDEVSSTVHMTQFLRRGDPNPTSGASFDLGKPDLFGPRRTPTRIGGIERSEFFFGTTGISTSRCRL
jgi:hypothetical protein